MRLVVTGGGTGGHVYPALEVARLAQSRGAELLYLGSKRGQEGRLCGQRGILFEGFPSEPLLSLRTPRGWRSLVRLLRAQRMAKVRLLAAKPDAVFSTGGYSAAPVLGAARSLRIPYVIHDGNSMPGRTNRMFGRGARSFLTVFFATERLYRDRPVVRTGQPIRKELREAASSRSLSDFKQLVLANAMMEGETTAGSERAIERAAEILVLGGSQGSKYLNEATPVAVAGLGMDVRVTHVSGPSHFASTQALVQQLGVGDYRVAPYLESSEIANAYSDATLVVCRSGGTLAELALFGLPSVLVPLPGSADDHQLTNAKEFAEMQAASVISQEATPFEEMGRAIGQWLGDPAARDAARHKLAEWDVPDATERIVAHVEAACR